VVIAKSEKLSFEIPGGVAVGEGIGVGDGEGVCVGTNEDTGIVEILSMAGLTGVADGLSWGVWSTAEGEAQPVMSIEIKPINRSEFFIGIQFVIV
jgi:hypothetical protein